MVYSQKPLLAAFPEWVFNQKLTDTMNYLATFDIDNTLVRSSAGHMESLILALKDFDVIIQILLNA